MRPLMLPLLFAMLALSALSGCGGPAAEAQALHDEIVALIDVPETPDVHAAWPILKRLRTEYPDEAATREIWPYATATFRALWWERRMKGQLFSDWMKTETRFMYDWLATFYEGDEFPREATSRLLQRMPYPVYRDFLKHTAEHPAVSRWQIDHERDNGRIEKITGSLRASAKTADAR